MGMKQHSDFLTKEFFEEHYVCKKMTYSGIRNMLLDQGLNIHVGTLFSYAKKLGIGRTVSESKRALDYAQSYLDERTTEAVDGFLLGDGSLTAMKNDIGRARCGVAHREFCEYLMSYFSPYQPVVKEHESSSMTLGVVQTGCTKAHPDFYAQYVRWYSEGKKQPPDDVRITPLSVMMWYLGDGSLVQGKNTVMLRLSTDGFSPDKVKFLSEKLKEKGIACHRNNENRIVVKAKGVPVFFNFIGRKSPVKCYEYKFDLPEWRFEAKRLSEVASELGVSYNRISHLVKVGKLDCYRASSLGRPRMLPEHIEQARKMIGLGELY